jgi:hypothetical protein
MKKSATPYLSSQTLPNRLPAANTNDYKKVILFTIGFNFVTFYATCPLHRMQSVMRIFPGVPRTSGLTSLPACFNIPRTCFINLRKDIYGHQIIG